MRPIVLILTTLLSWGITFSACADSSIESQVIEAQIDDREVYIITSRLGGKFPKIGPARHASIAICPKGVSPIVHENGVPVSNCRQCQLWGTQVFERGFKLDEKRIDARATKVVGISASTVERRIGAHRQMNMPLIHDCRHHVIQVLGLRNRRGRFRWALSIR